MSEKGWYLYLLRCRGGVLYCGISSDWKRRYREHCRGKGAQFTRSHPPESIACVWSIGEKGLALSAECRVKKLPAAKKRELIARPALLSEWLGIAAKPLPQDEYADAQTLRRDP